MSYVAWPALVDPASVFRHGCPGTQRRVMLCTCVCAGGGGVPSFICFRVSSRVHEGDNIWLHPSGAARVMLCICMVMALASARQDLSPVGW